MPGIVIFIFLIFFNALPLFAKDVPEKVYRLVYKHESKEWYQKQAQLWAEVVRKNPKNREGWSNYYIATEYARRGEVQGDRQDLAEILRRMEAEIPDSFEYYHMASRYDENNLAYLLKAHELKPENPDIYYSLITYYQAHGDTENANQFLHRLYESQDIASGLVNYNYNVLMSLKKNAILFTNGDNDSYPVWMLQTVRRIRPDVTVLNVHMINIFREHLASLLSEKNLKIDFSDVGDDQFELAKKICERVEASGQDVPVYLALTVHNQLISGLKDDLYIVGLAYRYHPGARLDNLALLEYNVNRFRLDNLEMDWYDERFVATASVTKYLNQNYVTPFMMLAKHFKLAGKAEQADYYRGLATLLAQRSQNEAILDYIRTEK